MSTRMYHGRRMRAPRQSVLRLQGHERLGKLLPPLLAATERIHARHPQRICGIHTPRRWLLMAELWARALQQALGSYSKAGLPVGVGPVSILLRRPGGPCSKHTSEMLNECNESLDCHVVCWR